MQTLRYSAGKGITFKVSFTWMLMTQTCRNTCIHILGRRRQIWFKDGQTPMTTIQLVSITIFDKVRPWSVLQPFLGMFRPKPGYQVIGMSLTQEAVVYDGMTGLRSGFLKPSHKISLPEECADHHAHPIPGMSLSLNGRRGVRAHIQIVQCPVRCMQTLCYSAGKRITFKTSFTSNTRFRSKGLAQFATSYGPRSALQPFSSMLRQKPG
ncbi:hypothetical protein B9Z55_007409 [Caenorhabditis nigoni]|uniref:Uncharacterized protein n=1 Tax=Caenorhabditis nigoni TaxID=1611254 RepID=A0A2G5V9M7_9PELO|nr:hypothetical protein B9Z55_007409 [Caenorhabditis nigoni]